MIQMRQRFFLTFCALVAASSAIGQVLGTGGYLANGLTTTVETVKPSNGTLAWYSCWNPNATVAYIQVFNQAAAGSVTLGTTVPLLSLPVTPTATIGGPVNVAFLAGIKVAATTTATGSTAPSVALDCSFGFQ